MIWTEPASSIYSRVPQLRFMRLMTKLLAIFGLYMIVLVRVAGGRSNSNSFTPFLLELAAVTVLFAIATVFLLTRRPRP